VAQLGPEILNLLLEVSYPVGRLLWMSRGERAGKREYFYLQLRFALLFASSLPEGPA
jgi:hypothetical protein